MTPKQKLTSIIFGIIAGLLAGFSFGTPNGVIIGLLFFNSMMLMHLTE